MTIDDKLAKLAAHMHTMAANDMGNLSYNEAKLFHAACDAVDRIVATRENKKQTALDLAVKSR